MEVMFLLVWDSNYMQNYMFLGERAPQYPFGALSSATSMDAEGGFVGDITSVALSHSQYWH
jgi:hypothetical protein